MSAAFPGPFRQVLKLNIEQSRRTFDTIMAVWRDNAAANFAFALRLIASKDASDALRLYAQHVQERIQTFSRQFQEISSLAVQIGAANKSEQFGDLSCTKTAANKADLQGIPTMRAPSHQGANGLLNSEVASALSSTQPRVAKRGAKSKKPRNLQKTAATPAAEKAASKQPKRRP